MLWVGLGLGLNFVFMLTGIVFLRRRVGGHLGRQGLRGRPLRG
jgi:hypothetical protein